MEAVLFTCIFATLALSAGAAPTYTESEEAQVATLARQYHPDEYQHLREPRSQYSPQYVLPCAAAAAASAPLHYAAAPYHLNVPAYPASHYGYGGQRYRSADEQIAEHEMLAFSDMDQMQHGHARMMNHLPMARAPYGAAVGSVSALATPYGAGVGPVSAISSGLALNGPVLTSASGPAYGIFPNANVGGCNVPLLFSCSPSISSGHMVESQGHGASVIAPVVAGSSYRLVSEPSHLDDQESEEVVDQHLEPAHETSHVHQAQA